MQNMSYKSTELIPNTKSLTFMQIYLAIMYMSQYLEGYILAKKQSTETRKISSRNSGMMENK